MNTSVPANVNSELYAICKEFMRSGYNLLGAYLDALKGLEAVRQEVIRNQNETIDQLKQTQPQKASEEFMDQQALDHRFEADQHGPEEILHRSTQGDFKQRTASRGLDARLLGHMMVALLYGYWEDKYRQKISLSLGHSKKNDLQSDLFGDIAKLRHAIIHNQGKATEDVAHAKVIRWFQRGDEIFISRDQTCQLLDEIDHYVSKLCGIQGSDK